MAGQETTVVNGRKPRYQYGGAVLLEIDHPDYGWIPFLATPDDVEAFGREIHARAVAGDFGEIATYVPEPPPAVVYKCTPWQIRKALNALDLRQSVESAVAASTDQTLKDGWEFATSFHSDDPFVISMGAALGKTEQETAELIQYAATL